MTQETAAPRAPRRRNARVLMACSAMVAVGAAHAQASQPPTARAAPMAAPAPVPHFAIRGFKVTGENPLGDAETARILAPYQRTDATMDTLQGATAALEKGAARKGLRAAPGGAAAAGRR